MESVALSISGRQQQGIFSNLRPMGKSLISITITDKLMNFPRALRGDLFCQLLQGCIMDHCFIQGLWLGPSIYRRVGCGQVQFKGLDSMTIKVMLKFDLSLQKKPCKVNISQGKGMPCSTFAGIFQWTIKLVGSRHSQVLPSVG